MAEHTRLAAVIEDGIAKRLHTGVQVYVCVRGEAVINRGFGTAGPGRPMTSDTLMCWRSAGKPLTALLVLKHVAAGRLTLYAPLSDSLPELDGTACDSLTLFELLTHTAGIPHIETGWPGDSWQQILDTIIAALAQRSPPTAAYQPQSSWFLLGEILRLLDGRRRDFSTLLQQELLEPAGMLHSSCGIDSQLAAEQNERIPTLYHRDRGQLVECLHTGGRWLTQPSPGGNLRGPVRDLGRFYELLLRQGRLGDGTEFVAPQSVAAMIRRQRAGEFDATFQHVIDFGLGVIVDSKHHGPDSVPYGFGRYCSPDTFGHGGAQCAQAFCDPARELVVAWAANGLCGEGLHQQRNRAINAAIYEDLGLASRDGV